MTKVTNDTLDFCGLNSDIAATPQQPDTVQITEASISLPENRRSLRCRRVQKDFPRGEASLRTPYSVYHSKWSLGSSTHVALSNAVTIDVAYEKLFHTQPTQDIDPVALYFRVYLCSLRDILCLKTVIDRIQHQRK